MDTLFTMLNTIRTQVLEYLTIPGLGISWWQFCLILLTMGIVIKVLLNAVTVSGSSLASRGRDEARWDRLDARRQARKKGK